MEGPKDVDIHTVSNRAYPVTKAHWQPVLAGHETPHKANVVISGASVLGQTAACLFALKGYHVTVIEKTRGPNAVEGDVVGGNQSQPAGAGNPPETEDEQNNKKNGEDHKKPTTDIIREEAVASATFHHPMEYGLCTLRGYDVLGPAGVPKSVLRSFGRVVSGVMDHPGGFNSLITRGLTERHAFATPLLSLDMSMLQRYLARILEESIPGDNARVFHEHRIKAVYPESKTVVVEPVKKNLLELDSGGKIDGKPSLLSEVDGSGNDAYTQGGGGGAAEDDDLYEEQQEDVMKARKEEVSSISYDLFIAADGANSISRDMLDIEGFATAKKYGKKWFVIRKKGSSSSTGVSGEVGDNADGSGNHPSSSSSFHLESDHVHRWIYPGPPTETGCPNYTMLFAFPRVDKNSFSVMIYGVMSEIEKISAEKILLHYMADLPLEDIDVVAEEEKCTPHPTIFCEHLYNTLSLPNAVVVGDAAHACPPLLMQGLSIGLEDIGILIDRVDSIHNNAIEALRAFSNQRGPAGDSLRNITHREASFLKRRHRNPFVRLYPHFMQFAHKYFPRRENEYHATRPNYLFPRSVEEMMNGKGYAAYTGIEEMQQQHYSPLRVNPIKDGAPASV